MKANQLISILACTAVLAGCGDDTSSTSSGGDAGPGGPPGQSGLPAEQTVGSLDAGERADFCEWVGAQPGVGVEMDCGDGLTVTIETDTCEASLAADTCEVTIGEAEGCFEAQLEDPCAFVVPACDGLVACATGAGQSGGMTPIMLPGEDGGPEFTLTEVPDAWERPDDCGGIGELCWDCGERGICQTLTETCVSERAILDTENNAQTDETPYCEAYACMNFEEASCYCTGPAGELTPECADGPAGVAGLCQPEGSSCTEDACCGELTCLNWDLNRETCYQACTVAEDCDSGCCTDLKDTGDLVCAPARACDNQCKREGEDCADQSECCRGACNSDASFPEWSGCRPRCADDSDCDGGCCIQYANTSSGFCADPGYCACQPEYTECGPDSRACCDSQLCLTEDASSTGFACRDTCTAGDQCESGCCAGTINGSDLLLCVDAIYCP